MAFADRFISEYPTSKDRMLVKRLLGACYLHLSSSSFVGDPSRPARLSLCAPLF